MSAPSITPSRSGATGRSRKPASTHAKSAAAKPSWMSRLMTFRLFRGRTYCFGSKSATAPPKGGRKAGIVERRQPPDAAAPFAQRRPKRLAADADRANQAHPGNHNVWTGGYAVGEP